MLRSRRIATPLVALILACVAGAASADAVKYRQAVMKAIGGHMGGMGQIAKGEVAHKGHLLEHAKSLEMTMAMVGDAFMEKTDDSDQTTAIDKIWSDWDGFSEKAKESSKAANVLVRTIENSGDVGAAMKALGSTCGGCHKAFRKKKE